MKKIFLFTLLCCLMTACSNSSVKTLADKKDMEAMMPEYVQKKELWADDVYHIMNKLEINRNITNVCSIFAVIDQESNFSENPEVKNLGKISSQSLHNKLKEYSEQYGMYVGMYIDYILRNKPTVENNYLKQISLVKNEKELSDINKNLIKSISLDTDSKIKYLGIDLQEIFNEVNTIGSMQVHIEYAKKNKRNELMSDEKLRDKLFTRYDGLYYGIHRLMLYKTDYSAPIYRFAEYNSGMYSSRNAAFQKMLNMISGNKLVLDGDLLTYNSLGLPNSTPSQTERTLQVLFKIKNYPITEKKIREDLKKEKLYDFKYTETYNYIVKLYEEKTKKKALYYIMPEVEIKTVKLKSKKMTSWYAKNVNIRFEKCIEKAKNLGFEYH